jgi:actin related protein 2/3 complex subunit 1A/1B
MRKFQSLDRQARIETSDTTLETIHQNAITCLCLYKGTKGSASRVSTSGLDGQLVIWDFQVVTLVIGPTTVKSASLESE